MRKAFVLLGVAIVAMLAGPSPALAEEEFECNGVYEDRVFENVTVPTNGACTLIDSTVVDDVEVLRGAYLQSTGTAIGGNVEGRKAQTVFLDTGTRVFGHVHGHGTIQVFIFFSTIVRSIEVENATDSVMVCGNKIARGGIEIERSGTDILVGDPLAEDCPGNVVKRGDVSLKRNFTDVEFVVRGNTIRNGSLTVYKNTGPVPKHVEDNTGGDTLRCLLNGSPFSENGNTGWDKLSGQCA